MYAHWCSRVALSAIIAFDGAIRRISESVITAEDGPFLSHTYARRRASKRRVCNRCGFLTYKLSGQDQSRPVSLCTNRSTKATIQLPSVFSSHTAKVARSAPNEPSICILLELSVKARGSTTGTAHVVVARALPDVAGSNSYNISNLARRTYISVNGQGNFELLTQSTRQATSLLKPGLNISRWAWSVDNVCTTLVSLKEHVVTP